MDGEMNSSDQLELNKIQQENQGLTEKIRALTTQAQELSMQLQNIDLNNSRYEFASYLQQGKISSKMQVITNLTDMVRKAEEERTSAQQELDACAKQKEVQEDQIKHTELSIECLEKVHGKDLEIIAELQQTTTILKNRNAAIRLKLEKQLRDYNEQIHKYSAILACQTR